MKAIIKNGGLDLNLYHTKNNTDLYSTRLNSNIQEYRDLIFFHKILEVIHLSIDEDDLRISMEPLFRERRMTKRDHKFEFNYYFGTFPGNDDAEEMDYMEVISKEDNRVIIYVEIEK